MADIELIIKIPEEVKQAFDCAESNDLKDCYYDHNGVIGNAIKNGRPLPKPHGRISDVGKVEKQILEYMDKHKDERGDGAYATLIMLNVETIIPATNAWIPKKIEVEGEEKCR